MVRIGPQDLLYQGSYSIIVFYYHNEALVYNLNPLNPLFVCLSGKITIGPEGPFCYSLYENIRKYDIMIYMDSTFSPYT